MRESARGLTWAGALSLATGLVHGALVNDHVAEWWAYGLFFMLASVAQVVYGFSILASHLINGSPISHRWPTRARRSFYLGGIALNAGLVAMYLWSRTVGVPLGPEAGEVEPWDGVGLFTKALELGTVLLLANLLRGAASSLHVGEDVQASQDG